MLINYTKITAVLHASQLHIIYILAYLNLYFVPDRPCRISFSGSGESQKLCLVLTLGREILYSTINFGFYLSSSIEMTLVFFPSFAHARVFVFYSQHSIGKIFKHRKKKRKMLYGEQSTLLFSPQPVLSTSTPHPMS